MASDRRRQQVAQRIRQRVSELLLFEVKDPRATFVTVTSVEISKDLAIAKVRWSVLEAKHRSKVEHMLEHASGYFRTEVARDLQLRTAPILRFEYDEGMARAQRIDEGFDEPEGVQDRTTGGHDPTRRIDVNRDVPVRILGFQEQQLSDHEIGQSIIDRVPDKDDVVLEQPRKYVVGTLPAAGLFDHHGN